MGISGLMVIVIVILLLYSKTYKHYYVIDDICERHHYLTQETAEIDDVRFYENRRDIKVTIVGIGTLILTCCYINFLWGIFPAVLYAVMPTNVCGTAWKVGNYYQTTVLFILVAHYFHDIFPPLTVLFYWASLQSTVSGIPYPFFLMFYNPIVALLLLPITISFMFGKKLRTALGRREDIYKDLRVSDVPQFHPKRLIVMVKILAYYIYLSFWPKRLGFFHDWPSKGYNYAVDRLFWFSLSLNVVFLCFGLSVDSRAILWWYIFMVLYSQWAKFGMIVAERYMLISNVAFCVLVSEWLLYLY